MKAGDVLQGLGTSNLSARGIVPAAKRTIDSVLNKIQRANELGRFRVIDIHRVINDLKDVFACKEKHSSKQSSIQIQIFKAEFDFQNRFSDFAPT